VGEERRRRSASYVGLIPFGYEVVSRADTDSLDRSYDYTVGFQHVTGSPSNVLRARFVQTSGIPMRRALDIHLHCLTAVMHDCSGLDELAPSAWADYLAREPNLSGGERPK
jgi:hypothetical protein